ncbi:Rod binding protein [Methylocella tundrae]|uniref:Rod binding protein n=1 Tax=Methylocella tundrae TaxID=227605 RepID=A0A8B6M6W9_METTU|nr:rod-binding protein [Methylocella tundrae]VTZ50060.1 Rod binding protein [Methylocella tundrae]
MSINPVSDIVLDVARAADPSKSLAAAERLFRLGAGEPAGADFSSVMRTSNSSDAELRSIVAKMSASPSPAATSPMDARTKAYKGVEELVLQNLVENMLPKEGSGVFGSGTAGDVWRSMLAEQLAKQIGKTVDLGLDKKAGATHGAVHAWLPDPHVTGRQS